MTGLLSGSQWTSVGATEISYYIAGQSGDEGVHLAGGSITALGSITGAEIAAMQNAMAAMAAVADITFTSVGSQADADLIWAEVNNADGQGALGWANFPGGNYSNTYNDYQSLITVNQEGYVGGSVAIGSYDYVTFIHELGHALGLSHPHDPSGSSSVFPGVSGPFGDYGDYDMNQGVYTMMSYNDGWQTAPHGASGSPSYGWAGTPMALDIAALQIMYGANTTAASGNDTYSLKDVNAAGTYYHCLWDTGGTDEIVGANGRANLIDLRAATLGDEAGGGGFVSYANGIHGGTTIANGVVIENATGGSLDDAIIGNTAANRIYGLAGADAMSGDAGADTLLGHAGNDTLDGGADNDTLNGGSDDDVITGGAGIDTLVGGTGLDTMDGGDDADSLSGGDGNDSITGGAGNDTLNGGAGSDTFAFAGVFGDDTIEASGGDAGETGNTIAFGSLVSEAMISAALAGNNNDLIITVSGGSGGTTQSGTITITGWAAAQGSGGGFGSYSWTAGGAGSHDLTSGLPAPAPAPDPDPAPGPDPAPAPSTDPIMGGRGSDMLTGTSGDELIGTGAGNDRAYGLGGNDTVIGDRGNDTLLGGDGDDSITGDHNNDKLFGEAGDDILDGGAGYDRVEGGEGNDLIFGGNYNDTLFGDAGDDTIDGGAHNDRMWGGDGSDSMLGGNDNDQIYGEADDDILFGEAGADALYGDAGNDTLDGGRDADYLTGGDGDDSLIGGAGSDYLVGEAGNDTLDGGDHADTYLFVGAFGEDVITGLEDGDKIHLAGFRAVKGAAMNMRDLILTQQGADVLIELDLDRDTVADSADYDGDLAADTVSVLVQNVLVADLDSGHFIL